jgi:guanosine-3',5'-bis(diphosphate) 3'-pyrophosphohydrolase
MSYLVPRAADYARAKHAGQTYGPNKPYAWHVGHVGAIAACTKGMTEQAVAAAWLHDVLEDTDATPEEVERLFGAEVRAIVEAVTDSPGRNRRERHALTYVRTRALPLAVGVKLCDRIANVEACRENNPGLLKMYQSEQAEFRAALYREGEWEALWRRLEGALENSF